MKKRIFLVVAVLLIFGLFAACAPTPQETSTASTTTVTTTTVTATTAGTTSAEETTKQEEKKLKIFMTNAYYTAPYCSALNAAAMARAEELGVELQIVDGNADAQVQLDQLKTAVSQKVDGLIYFPADAASTPPVVEYLNGCGIPYIVMNSAVDPSVQDQVPCFVGIDELQHGLNVGKMIKEIIGNEGNIVIVEGAAGSNFTMQLTNGINTELEGTNIKILARQAADWDPAKAMQVTEDFLAKYGDQIDLIVSHDGGMEQGVASALEAAGLDGGKIPVVCSGSFKCVKEGLLNGTVYGTSTQDPVSLAQIGIDTMIKVINGETVEAFVKLPIKICKKEDVENYNWF